MANRIPSHQLSGGLYVSGRPDQPKDRPPTMSARAAPFTGGDVKNSGDLGRMFVVPPTADPPAKTPAQRPPATTSSSGPLRSGSGPIPLPPTGLITSGPIRSGQLDAAGGGGVKPSASFSYGGGGGGVTHAVREVRFRFPFSWLVFWVVLGVLGVGFGVGGFMMGTMKQPVVLIAVGGVLVLVLVFVVWNWGWGRRGLLRYLRRYPDAELRGAREGQFIKVTGVIFLIPSPCTFSSPIL